MNFRDASYKSPDLAAEGWNWVISATILLAEEIANSIVAVSADKAVTVLVFRDDRSGLDSATRQWFLGLSVF